MFEKKEKIFLDALESLFTGAKVEGKSGFVNLMRIKHRYFEAVQDRLMEEIKSVAPPETAFREELFDKLHSFFSRYFCESGSIYFRHLPAWQRIYERVYADGEDVALTWKTRGLYYVKSDYLVRSMPVEWRDYSREYQEFRFYFDASEIEQRKNNERREFLFSYDGIIKDKERSASVRFKVGFSANGTKTCISDILKKLKETTFRHLREEDLKRAFAVFRRQTEADFFIHKDAGGFLREQFDLWMYQYIYREESVFNEERLAQLRGLRSVALHIINFIAQFEDELARIWRKPKFARAVNYVITTDKIKSDVLKKMAKHKGAKKQAEEWRKLGLTDEKFGVVDFFTADMFLPIDTQYFKDMEADILDCLGDLDAALDGELVHSENYQALNTLLPKYQGRVKCIYIDPPFNLDGSDQFDYRTNYKDSCWATMLENRLRLAKNYLSDDGAIFVRCDNNGNHILRFLMNSIFNLNNFRNHIILGKSAKITEEITKYHSDHDSLFFYSRSANYTFKAVGTKRKKRGWQPMHLDGIRWSPIPLEYIKLFSLKNIKKENDNKYKTRARIILGKEMLPPEGRHWALKQKDIFEAEKRGDIKIGKNNQPESLQGEYKKLTDNWTDSVGYARNWDFPTENHELVLYRTIQTVSERNKVCLDFFSGSGTTQAVAQKLGRKWLGVEMGEHFYTVIIPRMKKTLAGYQSGISKAVEYKGGGAFKYYALEQYEEVLKNARYKKTDFNIFDANKTPFEQYVFMCDDKFTSVVEAHGKEKKRNIKLNLQKLYSDLDIAESIANIRGKPVRRLTADTVTFADGLNIKLNPAKMTEKEKIEIIEILKPYLWWGEEA